MFHVRSRPNATACLVGRPAKPRSQSPPCARNTKRPAGAERFEFCSIISAQLWTRRTIRQVNDAAALAGKSDMGVFTFYAPPAGHNSCMKPDRAAQAAACATCALPRIVTSHAGAMG